MDYHIKPLEAGAMAKAQERLDNLIKPVGSLGKLEKMIVQYAGITGNSNPESFFCTNKGIIVIKPGTGSGAEKNVPVLNGVGIIRTDIVVSEMAGSDYNMNTVADKVQDFCVNNDCDIVSVCLTGQSKKLIEAGAAAMLQAAAEGIALMCDGDICREALKLGITYNHLVESYWMDEDILQIDTENIPGLKATLEFMIFDAGLKCYREMQTFAGAGVDRPLSANGNRGDR